MKYLSLLLAFIYSLNAFAIRTFPDQTLVIGGGGSSPAYFQVDVTGSNNPGFKFDPATTKWYFTKDGTTYLEFTDKAYVDAADALKANIASPTFTGVPLAPTAAGGTNTAQIATTAFVQAAVSGLTVSDATTIAKGIVQLAGDLGGTAASPTVPGLALKAPLASPALTGTPTAPTAAGGTNTAQIATTAFVTSAVSGVTVSDATTLAKGIIQLAGDLGGTTASPTVTGLSNKVDGQSSSVDSEVALFSGTGGKTIKRATGTGFVKVTSGVMGTPVSTVSLTSEVANTLPVSNGGTGQSSLTLNNIPLGNGTSAVNQLAPGNEGNVVLSDGTTWNSSSLLVDNGVFAILNGADFSSWTTGNNATFLTAGSVAGTFAKETSSPFNGLSSYKFTQATSINDWVASPTISVPLKFRGKKLSVYFPYSYTGADTDIEPIIWDATNSAKLSTSSNLLPSSSGKIYQVLVDIPSTCTQLKWGFQVKVTNAGKIFAWDDIAFSQDTTKYFDGIVVTDPVPYTPAFTGFGTVTNIEAYYRRIGSSIELDIKFTSGNSTATEARVSLPLNYTSTTTTQGIHNVGGMYRGAGSAANFFSVLAESAVGYITIGIASNSQNPLAKANGSDILVSGNSASIRAMVPIAGLTASNPQIITAAESFSTDTASLVYAGSGSYTLSTLTSAPIGTFITYTYASSTNTQTQTTVAPTQTTSDMNVNGIQITPRAYNATSTSASPTAIAIQIGKGLKDNRVTGYRTTGRTGFIETSYQAVSTTETGFGYNTYNELTGILYLDAGHSFTASSTTRLFKDDTLGYSSSGYFVINASKSPALVGVPQVQPRFATIKDVKSAGTVGGACTTGSWGTRTLNTLDDPTGLVTSLSSNQFTLPAGTYFVEADSPSYSVSQFQAKLYNVTDSADTIIGGSEYTLTSASAQVPSKVIGYVTITASKTFELRHQCASAGVSSTGLGTPSSLGVSEIYAQVKITKVK